MVEEVKEDRVEVKPEFLKELMSLINRHSVENGSNTPDYMLAAFLGDILQAFSSVVRQRDEWHGFKPLHHDTLDNFIKKNLGIEKPTPEGKRRTIELATSWGYETFIVSPDGTIRVVMEGDR